MKLEQIYFAQTLVTGTQNTYWRTPNSSFRTIYKELAEKWQFEVAT